MAVEKKQIVRTLLKFSERLRSVVLHCDSLPTAPVLTAWLCQDLSEHATGMKVKIQTSQVGTSGVVGPIILVNW